MQLVTVAWVEDLVHGRLWLPLSHGLSWYEVFSVAPLAVPLVVC